MSDDNKTVGAENATPKKHTVLDSSFPVFLPQNAALFMPESAFQEHIEGLLGTSRKQEDTDINDEPTAIERAGEPPGSTVTIAQSNLKRRASSDAEGEPFTMCAFTEGLSKHAAHLRTLEDLAAGHKTLTENADVTNVSAKNPLVDLFYDLAEDTESDSLKILLENAWKEDALVTLKLIFNARSIHLGKSNRVAAYKAMGWLAETHPLTFLSNLKWLVRPVIEKKKKDDAREKEKAEGAKTEEKGTTVKDEDEDFEMLEADDEDSTDKSRAHDVRFGVSHGYWKDLLNLVVFAANDELKFDGDPKSLLQQKPDNTGEGKRKRVWDQAKAKELRKQKRDEQHKRVIEKLENDGFYQALHITVARLFAEQLKEDAKLLKSGKKAALKKLSLAGKWAPSFGEFHDKNTFILSSIAEILYPKPEEICPDASNRELYLRCAREAFRKSYSSPLRKALSVVERDIAAEKFDQIEYERVPSLAMDRYTKLFIKKDYEHFLQYINKVAEGKTTISGATLLPSTLVSKALSFQTKTTVLTSLASVTNNAQANIGRKVLNGQWKTIVQRLRDAGTLESSIAVCDVSGSMSSPVFDDGSCPMDSAIGLSLLIAEVTAPPFGGSLITFSSTPSFVSVGGEKDPREFVDKVDYIKRTDWGYNTNFVAVFEDLILPMAVHNNLKPEDMVKQVFVFSDMQFDAASGSVERWDSAFERIKQRFTAAGYEIPRLIFWNLAAGKTDKPVTMDDMNTALVSGYSQGMLRAFLDGGGFEDTDVEEVVEEDVEEDEDDGMTLTDVKVKKKINPLTIVYKAISHEAYSMLEVVD